MGYWTPNIDPIGKEGAMFTCWYGQQSCTAGRAAFITGQSPIRTGLTKVGLPSADIGLSAKDPTIAELLEQLGYATGQFGKNHSSNPCLVGRNSSLAPRWLESFKEFPIRQKPASFNLDEVMRKLSEKQGAND